MRKPHSVLSSSPTVTGWRGSFRGDLQMMGKMGAQFFTRTKTVTASWRDHDPNDAIPGLAGVGASTPA